MNREISTQVPTPEQEAVAEELALKHGRSSVEKLAPLGAGAVLVTGLDGDRLVERIRVTPTGLRRQA